MTTEVQATQEFLRQFPGVCKPDLEERMPRAWRLYRQSCARPFPREPHVWNVRCDRPERTRPGEPTSYVAVIAGGPVDWRCECGDAVWGRCVCKHELAAWLTANFGPAPGPGRRVTVVTADPAYEAWLDRVEAEMGAEPPEGPDWSVGEWADDDLVEVGETAELDMTGHLWDRARR